MMKTILIVWEEVIHEVYQDTKITDFGVLSCTILMLVVYQAAKTYVLLTQYKHLKIKSGTNATIAMHSFKKWYGAFKNDVKELALRLLHGNFMESVTEEVKQQ